MTVFKKYNEGTAEWEAIAVGLKGDKGDPGDPGGGLPTGGTAGQYIVKQSTTDFDTAWVTPTFVDAAGAVSAIKADADWNATDWDTAFGWGDHAAAGYLTSFTETDPTVPSHVKSITTTQISNWDDAYSWGDHSLAGYVPNTVTVTGSNGLTGGGALSSNQVISHADTSSQASVDNSGTTVIQDVTLDTYGHVTGLGSTTLSIPAAANNGTLTVSGGTGLSGTGTFTADQATNTTITLNHGDTSTLSGTYGSTANGTKIDQITVDDNGHVTAITTGATGDIDGVTAGTGLTGGGTSGTVTLNLDTTAGAVGTYAFLGHASLNTVTTFGSTLAGSSLAPAGIVSANSEDFNVDGFVSAYYDIPGFIGVDHGGQASTRAGTWRCMGVARGWSEGAGATLWVRIA